MEQVKQILQGKQVRNVNVDKLFYQFRIDRENIKDLNTFPMRTFVLALALLMPVAMDGLLLAEVVPEVLIEERKEKSSLDDDIKQLKKEAEEELRVENYQKAIELYIKILDFKENQFGLEDPKITYPLDNLAFIYKKQGLYSKAEQLYLRSLSILEKNLKTEREHLNYAVNLSNLAFLYKEQGFYNKAESIYLQTLSVLEKNSGTEHPNYATTLNNLSQLYLYQGLNKKSESLLRKALSIDKKNYGFEHPLSAVPLNNLAMSYLDRGDYRKAESLLIKVINILEKNLGAEHSKTGIAINNLALLYHKKGLYKKAEPLYLRSISIGEKVYGSENRNNISRLFNLALLYEAQRNYKKAERIYRLVQRIQIKLIQREAPYLSISDRQNFVKASTGNNRYYFKIFSSISKNESFEKLALFSRLNLHGLLEEIEKRQSQLISLPGPQKEIVEELKIATQKLASLDVNQQKYDDLIKRKVDLEKKIYALLPDLRPRIFSVDEVSEALPNDAVLIEFQRFKTYDFSWGGRWKKNHYIALVLKPNGEILSINLGLAKPIENKIKKALTSSEEGLEDAQRLWNEVGRMVIKPLASSIGNAKTLFISPDAELNRIPFSAVSSYKDNQLLSDIFKIRLLTNGRELINLSEELKPTNQKPLVVANPNFNLDKNSIDKNTKKTGFSHNIQMRSLDLSSFKWNSLPGTAKEGKIISKLIGANLLTQNEATVSAIQKQSSPKLLHIASHSYFLPTQEKGENPLLRSGIVLAGANEPELNSYDDGYLTALELAKLDLKGTELVVISGCESGLGDIRSGESVYGLKRSITVAGARSSLLSLWKVSDQGTALFMESFYKKLSQGKSKADALVEIQKEFRNHPIPAFRHPGLWAAFQLSGDWRPIDW